MRAPAVEGAKAPGAAAIIYARRADKPAPSRMSMSYVLSGIAIVVCAVVGATAAWFIVSSIGWSGVAGAVATTALAMVLATLLFAGGVVLGKALGIFK
jgi:hypothetical protein